MSLFSVTAIDRLIEPAQGSSLPRSAAMERERPSAGDKKQPFSFYPPLYATPPPQRPPSPSSLFSPSPYVVNHKRRGPASNGVHNAGILDNRAASSRQSTIVSESPPGVNNGLNVNLGNAIHVTGLKSGEGGERGNGEIEVFDIKMHSGEFPSRERGNPKSGSFSNSLHFKEATLSSATFSVPGEEFYDAPDAPLDASEDEASLFDPRSLSLDSNELAARLQNEILRRMKVEEALHLFQMHWNETAKRCAPWGVSMSQLSESESIGLTQVTSNASDVLVGKLAVARMVCSAIASAATRAEKDEEMERLVAAKNREISRLFDKLQYYELVNREMSQRNQEAVESAQQHKRRRQRKQKWMFRGFCAALCVGTTGLLCYKLFSWEQAKGWLKSLNETLQSVEPSDD